MQATLVKTLMPWLLAAPLCAQEATKQEPAKTEPATAPERLKLGDVIAAEVALPDLDGKLFRFGDAAGKPVVVHFWSITCPWEKDAEPKLQEIATDYPDAIVLAVNANRNEIGEAPEAAAFEAKDDAKPYGSIRAHVKSVKLNHRVLLDHDGKLAHLLNAQTTPHCFVFDPEGTLVYQGALDNDPKGEKGDEGKAYVRLALDAVKANKEIEVKSSRPYG